jgi:drug/metabolite transporter (DMT)-like permease
MNLFKAITAKLVSLVLFVVMSALVRLASETIPLGEIVFFRSFFAILPVMAIYAWQGQVLQAVATRRPLGHVGRGMISVCGMFLNFAALARLPLVDATVISYAAPLITVAFAAMFLGERVGVYRWSAVAVGFVGVIVMLWPYIDFEQFTAGDAAAATATVGAACALMGAVCNAGSVVQTRRLTSSETTSSIVFYFSLICALAGLATLPFGWVMPGPGMAMALVCIGILGGLAHIVLTASYRYAPASVVAPLDYTSMIWAFLLGYWLFGEVPTIYIFVGGAIVAASGIFVIWRERQLGLRRIREAEAPPSGA